MGRRRSRGLNETMNEWGPAGPRVNRRPCFRVLTGCSRAERRLHLCERGYPHDSSKNLKNGIRKYSEGYFYSEVTDALVGMISNKEIDLSFNAIRSVGKIETDSVELIKSMGVPKDDGVRILSALYDAGAIINYKIVSGKRFYTSKFRNRHSTFNENNLIMVHSGLHKAFSLGNDED